MNTPKKVLVVHASDAEQHLGYFEKILSTLKQEERIGGHTTIESSLVDESLLNGMGNEDMVAVLLTNDMVDSKESLETLLLDLKKRQPNTNVIEILVDNVPYETSFIAFPTSLQPIRSSENMDVVWQDISENLKNLFPKPVIEPIPEPAPVVPPPPPTPKSPLWKKFLPYILGLLVLCLLAFFAFDYFRTKKGNGQAMDSTVLQVENIRLQVKVQNPVSNNCPEKINFEANIFVNNKGTVKYRWVRSDGSKTNAQNLTFSGKGKKTVTDVWEYGTPGQNYSRKWSRIEILAPKSILSEKAEFNLKCNNSTSSGINIDFKNRGASRIINQNAFSQEGIRAVRAKPSNNYCPAAKPAIMARGTSNSPHSFLSTADPANLNSCHGIIMEFDFTRPVKSVTVLFHGAAVANKLTAFRANGTVIDSRSAQAVPYNYSNPFKVTYTSSSTNISRISFGYQTATTHITSIIAN